MHERKKRNSRQKTKARCESMDTHVEKVDVVISISSVYYLMPAGGSFCNLVL